MYRYPVDQPKKNVDEMLTRHEAFTRVQEKRLTKEERYCTLPLVDTFKPIYYEKKRYV